MGEQQPETPEAAVSLPEVAEHIGHAAMEAPFFGGLNIADFQKRLEGPVAGEPEQTSAPQWSRRVF